MKPKPSHPNFSISAFQHFSICHLLLCLLLLAAATLPVHAGVYASRFDFWVTMDDNAVDVRFNGAEALGLSDAEWAVGWLDTDFDDQNRPVAREDGAFTVTYGGSQSAYSLVSKLKKLKFWEGPAPAWAYQYYWNWYHVKSYRGKLTLQDGTTLETSVIVNPGGTLTQADTFSMGALGDELEKKLPNDAATLSCTESHSPTWNQDYQFEVTAGDDDGHSEYSMSAVVKSGSDIVPGTAVTVSGMNPFTIGLKPNKDKFGTVTLELQCSDKYRQDPNKTLKVTKTVTVNFQRPVLAPTISLVSAMPPVRLGGTAAETCQVRVSDDFTSPGQIKVSAMVLGEWPPAHFFTIVNSNGLCSITHTSPPFAIPTELGFLIRAEDADGGIADLDANIIYHADKSLVRPTTSATAFALLFAGTDSVNLPAGTWFNGDFTIEAWVRPNQFVSGASLLSFGNDASSDAVTLGFTGVSGQLSLQVRNGSQSQQLNSTSLISTSGWTHVAATLSQQRATLYINGQSAGILEGMPFPASVTRSLNRFGGGGYAGFLDEVRLWSVARTPDEIQAGMYVGMATSSETLVGYWPLNQGTGKFIANAAKSAKALAMGSAVPAEAMVPVWVEGVPYELTFTCNEDSIGGFAFQFWRSPLHYYFTQLPSNGRVTTNASIPYQGIENLTYRPTTDFSGSDRAVLVLGTPGGAVRSAPQAIRFIVNPVNDAPIVGSGRYLDFAGNATTRKDYAVGGEGSKTGLDFSARDPFTLETWVYPSQRTEQELLGKWALALPGGYRLFLTATDGRVAFARSRVDRNGRDLTDLTQMAVSSVSIPLSQWTHVAAVYDGAQSIVYINGQLAAMLADSANGLSAKAQPIRLAAAWDSTNSLPIRLFSGALNETRIWSVARGASDIITTMSSPLTGQESGLEAYYRMMEGSGSRLYDWAGKGLYNMSGVTSDTYSRFTWGTGAANLSEVIVLSLIHI